MAAILDTHRTTARIDRLVHLDTQKAAVGLDLTAGAIYRLTGPGRLDFGGSELRAAGRQELEPELASPDDDYGWWRLEAGTYALRYNEAVEPEEGEVGFILPLERVLRAGASHPAFAVDGRRDPLETLFTVGRLGCHLKENCRVSLVLIMAAR